MKLRYLEPYRRHDFGLEDLSKCCLSEYGLRGTDDEQTCL